MRRMRRYQACYAVSRLWVSLPGPRTQTMTASSGRAKVLLILPHVPYGHSRVGERVEQSSSRMRSEYERRKRVRHTVYCLTASRQLI